MSGHINWKVEARGRDWYVASIEVGTARERFSAPSIEILYEEVEANSVLVTPKFEHSQWGNQLVFVAKEATPVYQSTKRYGHEIGLSCAFRQWKADSHCRFVHGYALAFKFIFESEKLDVRNWCVDFGGLKPLKQILEDTFDHKLVVAEDDPQIEYFRQGDKLGVLELVEVPAGGCEKFAEMTYEVAEQWLIDGGYGDRVRLVSVEVSEHGANSAIFFKRHQ